MKAIDTNVLVRFLVRDDKKQAEIVRDLFKQAEKNNETIFIPLLVVLETIWVLESVYEISREEIVDTFQELLLMPILSFESPSVLQNTLSTAQKNKIDLSDLLIAHSANSSGCESVLTFDKKASRSALFQLLK